MAIDKQQKPTNLVPRSFGGEKNNFSDDLIASGFEPNTPETYNGDNLNYQLDATGKELDYCEKVVDYINGLGVGKTPIVNANNKLDETQVGLKVYSATETYSLSEWVRSGDKIYQSLTQGNLGNDLTNETYWKEVEFGGLPSQLNKNGKFLKTDGEQASWEDVPPATILNQNIDLLKAGDKKVQFMCSQEAPVKVKFVDGTEQELTSIADLDMSEQSAGTYNIACNKQGTPYLSGIVGDVSMSTSGIVSNFSTSNYINTINTPSFGTNTWESVVKFTTGENVTTEQGVWGGASSTFLPDIPSISTTSHFTLNLSSNGSSYDISNTSGTYTVLANTTYWVRVKFTGTEYTLEYSLDGETYTQDISVTSSTAIESTTDFLLLGCRATAPFLGTIDLSETYLKVGDTIKWSGTYVLNESSPPFLGTVTLDSNKAITSLTNNYAAQTKNPLEQVNVHTVDSYSRVTEDEPTELNMVPFTFVDLNYTDYTTISANTNYTLKRDGVLNTTSLSTITLVKDGITSTVYGAYVPIRAGDTFKSSVAGKFYYYEG